MPLKIVEAVFKLADTAVNVVREIVNRRSQLLERLIDAEKRVQADDGREADIAEQFQQKFFFHGQSPPDIGSSQIFS